MLYNTVEHYFRQVYAADEQAFLALLAFLGVAVAIALGFSSYFVVNGFYWLRGKLEMRKRSKLRKQVRELIEEEIVDMLSAKIDWEYERRIKNARDPNKVTLDEAKAAYVMIAHAGFWGIHPKRFVPRVSVEALMDLKERLSAKHPLGKQRDQGIDLHLDSLATELA